MECRFQRFAGLVKRVDQQREWNRETGASDLGCGTRGRVKQPPVVRLTDVPVFGRPAVAAWRKVRRPALTGCVWGSWTTSDARIAAPRGSVTHHRSARIGGRCRWWPRLSSKRLLTSGSVQPGHQMRATGRTLGSTAAPI